MNFDLYDGEVVQGEIVEDNGSMPISSKGALVIPTKQSILDAAKAFDNEIAQVKHKVDTLDVKTKEDHDAIADTRRMAKDLLKSITDRVDIITAEIRKRKKESDDIKRYYKDSLGEIVSVAEAKILVWNKEQAIIRAQEERERKEAERKERERLEALAKKNEIVLPPEPVLPQKEQVDAAPKTTVTASGAKQTMVDRWTYDQDMIGIQDMCIAALEAAGYTIKPPSKKKEKDADMSLFRFLSHNHREIMDAIKGGVRKIRGITIFNDPYIR
jgi:hypothetical protein